jgi:monoamine oxidase
MAFAGSDIAPEEQGWFEGALASAEGAVTALAETVLSI